MRATLKYNLPDEESEFRAAQDGMKYKAAILEIQTWLRNQEKYGELNMGSTTEAISGMRKFIVEILESYNLNLE